jgi:hypothetical protein
VFAKHESPDAGNGTKLEVQQLYDFDIDATAITGLAA